MVILTFTLLTCAVILSWVKFGIRSYGLILLMLKGSIHYIAFKVIVKKPYPESVSGMRFDWDVTQSVIDLFIFLNLIVSLFLMSDLSFKRGIVDKCDSSLD